MKLLEKLFGIEIVEPEEPQTKISVNTTGINEITSEAEMVLAFVDLLNKKETERTPDENALCDLDFELFDKMMVGEITNDEYWRQRGEIMDIYAQLR